VLLALEICRLLRYIARALYSSEITILLSKAATTKKILKKDSDKKI